MKSLSNFDQHYKIPTNSSIDELLDGGVDKGTITQFFGPPSSGKTNIALTLAINVARSGKKVIYIDTEGGISIERVKQISKYNFDKVASNMLILEPSSFLEQCERLKTLDSWLKINGDQVDLIIIDSMVALYRIDDMKSSKLNKELGKQMGMLTKIARKYNIAVVLTNQIYASIDDEGNDSIKPIGGTVLQYWSKIIVQLEKSDESNERIAILKRHRSVAEGNSVNFRITNNGIR